MNDRKLKKLDNTYRRLLATLAALLTVLSVSAQFDTQLSQYWAMPAYYNPAATGTTDYLHIGGGTRLQWIGIPKAPKAFLAGADMPVKLFGKRIGVGVMVQQESLGLFSNLNAGAQASYKMKLFKGTLSIGVQLGLFDQGFKGSEVYIPDGDDYHEKNDNAIHTNDLHGTAFDLNFGVWYTHKILWAGLSMTHITQPTVKLNTQEGSDDSGYESQAGRMLYFMAGSNIPIKNTLFEIQPSLLLRSDIKSMVQAEVTARVRYNRFLSGGVAYRYNDAVSLQLGAEYKNFFVGYSYDYPLSAISKASSGSHEILVGYNMKLNLAGKNKNKHKSIRIM